MQYQYQYWTRFSEKKLCDPKFPKGLKRGDQRIVGIKKWRNGIHFIATRFCNFIDSLHWSAMRFLISESYCHGQCHTDKIKSSDLQFEFPDYPRFKKTPNSHNEL